MPIGSGISAQLGMKAESTYGTPVVVDRFFELVREGIAADVRKLYGRGLRAGGARFQRADRVKTYTAAVAGDIEIEVPTKNAGLLFQHMLGGSAVAGGGADKTHTFTPDAAALQGKFLTVQVGRPDIAGTVQPFTYASMKVASWQLAAALDDILKLTLTLDGASVSTATALASVSYPTTDELFVFTEGALTVGGPTVDVRSFNLTGNNGLDTDSRFLGNSKKEPLAAAEAMLEGTLDAEFEDLTKYADWIAGAQAQLVLTFTSPTDIPTSSPLVPFKLTVTIPAIEYTGDEPQVGGPDIVRQNLPFKGLDDGTNPPITIEYVTNDTAP